MPAKEAAVPRLIPRDLLESANQLTLVTTYGVAPVVGGLLLSFAGILYLWPNIEHPRWKFLSFGATFAVVLWLLASGAFAIYVSMFGSYNKAWGSLSAVVILMTWFWLSGVALLLGAEINAEAERSRELRRGEPAEVELTAPAKA